MRLLHAVHTNGQEEGVILWEEDADNALQVIAEQLGPPDLWHLQSATRIVPEWDDNFPTTLPTDRPLHP